MPDYNFFNYVPSPSQSLHYYSNNSAELKHRADKAKSDMISSVHNRVLNKQGLEIVGILRYEHFLSCTRNVLLSSEPSLVQRAGLSFFHTVVEALMNLYTTFDIASFIGRRRFVLVHRSELPSMYKLDVFNHFIASSNIKNTDRLKSRMRQYRDYCETMVEIQASRNSLTEDKIASLETQLRSLQSLSLEQSDYKW
jgi:hypothetical protein